MTKFVVTVREIQAADYVVEAETEEDARQKVAEGNGEYQDAQFLEIEDDIQDWPVHKMSDSLTKK